MRRLLGPDSVEGRGDLRLVLPGDVWIDVEAAERHVELADRAFEQDRYPTAQQEARGAGELLEDEFLPGCAGPWVEERRSELDELGRHARELESRAALASGDAAGAERIARRLVERAPYRESAYAALMEALAAQGNVAEALLVYDRLVHMLRDDLGTVPHRLSPRCTSDCWWMAGTGCRRCAAQPPQVRAALGRRGARVCRPHRLCRCARAG